MTCNRMLQYNIMWLFYVKTSIYIFKIDCSTEIAGLNWNDISFNSFKVKLKSKNISNAVIINNKIEPLLSTTTDLGLKVEDKSIC
jgi:hypothetical protein